MPTRPISSSSSWPPLPPRRIGRARPRTGSGPAPQQREAEVTQLVGALDSAHSAVATAYAIAGSSRRGMGEDMAASDQYQVDIASVKGLIQAWKKGSDELNAISKQLSNIHEQLMGCIPSALFEGLLGEVPLAESFAKVAAAASVAQQVAQGLAQDTASLDATSRRTCRPRRRSRPGSRRSSSITAA